MATTYPWTSGAPHSPLVPGGLDWNWAYGFSSSSATVANVPAGYVTLHMELQNNFTVSGSAYPYFGISFPYPTLGMGTAPSSVAGPLVKTANAWDSVTWRFNAFTSGTTASFTFLHPGGEFSMQLSAGSGNRSHCFVGDPVWETFCPPGPPTIVKLIPASGPDTGGTVVDIIGANLTGATAVDFGGTAGTGLTVDPSGNLATVTSPAHTAGPAPVTITTPAGTSAAKTFTYEAPPVVTVPVIYGAYPVSLCADAPDKDQVLVTVIYPATDVVSAEVGGVNAGVGGVLDPGGIGYVFMGAPVLPPGTYDLILTNSAGSSDPWPIEYLDCEGCPPDPTVVAVFPGAARPGATIQIVGTNLTDATVTMCGETVAIVSNDGTIITVVVPPGCPDGDTTITVTTPDGETTVEFAVLPVPEPGECPSLTDWCAPDTPCPDCTPCVAAPPRPLIAMWADLAARIRCGWPDDRCPPGAVTVEATQQPPGSDCDAEVQVIPGGPAGADHAGVTTWGGRVVVLRPWAQINEAGQLTDAAQAQRLEAIARSLEDLQIMQQLIVAAACGACGPGGATIERVERVTSTTTLGWAFAVRIS
jgi:hypothetical protein